MKQKKIKSPEQVYEEVFEEPWGFCKDCDQSLPLKYLRGRDGALFCVVCMREAECEV